MSMCSDFVSVGFSHVWSGSLAGTALNPRLEDLGPKLTFNSKGP